MRRDYDLSLHGVGLSLGSATGVDTAHLRRVKALAERFAPFRISEHLSWSVSDGHYLNDLLPLPYTEESLTIVCQNVEQFQVTLGRSILLENPSTYLRFRHSTIPEAEFIAEIARRAGCGLLCDVNNIYVTCQNFHLDPLAYLDALSPASVGEIHLAGHFKTAREGRTLLIDDHGTHVSPAVWELYGEALERFGGVPTLIEWDRNLPDLDILLAEARLAEGHARAALVPRMERDHAVVA